MLFVPYTEADYEIANSYLSVLDADDIIAKQINSASWVALSTPFKQMLLIQASLAVDGALQYQYDKTSDAQVLKFPRNTLLTLPKNIIFATAITAMKYSNDDIFKGVSREKIAKHETEYFEDKGIADDVLVFLKPLQLRTIKLSISNE